MYPFTPSTPPNWLAGATSYFSRLRAVSIPDSAAAADEDFTNWSKKLNFNSAENRLRRNLDFNSPVRGGTDIVRNLLKPFKETTSSSLSARRDEIVEEEEKEVLELRGSFGHIVWPLYPNQTSKDTQNGMGPVLSGEWDFTAFEKWLKTEPNLNSFFMPA